MPSRIIAAAGMAPESVRELYCSGGETVVVDTRPGTGNTCLEISSLERLLPGPMEPVWRDLLELSAAIVVGDTAHRRGPNEHWSRDVVCHFAARVPLALDAVLPRLQSLLGFATGDAVRIETEARPVADPPGESPVSPRPAPDADCVCLLSGGLDSLAGAVTLLTAGRRPVFVLRATGNAATAASQSSALEALQGRFGPSAAVSVTLHGVTRTTTGYPFPDSRDREPSQRSRSLFPLAVAAVVCAGLGLTEIHVPENGILAAQAPFTRARLGGFTTRTTNPQWLRGAADVFCALLGTPIAVHNPLIGQTKAEIVRDILLPSLGESAIRRATSCWSIGRGPLACGGCVPCLLRRFAFETADLAPEAVQRDAVGVQSADGSEGRRNLVAVLSLVRDFRMLPDDCLRARYPELAYAGEHSAVVVAALRRFASEVYELTEARLPDLAHMLGVGAAENELRMPTHS